MSWVGVNMPTVCVTASTRATTRPTASATRPMLQRWRAMRCRSGASARNSARRLRPSSFMAARSWVGLATPRVAAKASAMSSGVNSRSARW